MILHYSGVIIITAGLFAAIYAGIPLLATSGYSGRLYCFLCQVCFFFKVAPLQSKMKQYLDTSIRNGN